MQVVNPLLVLAFIPIFDRFLYPLLSKCGILKKPLQRLTVGGIFAGISFAVSGIVELQLEKTYALELETGHSSLHFVNAFDCPYSVTLNGSTTASVAPGDMHLFKEIRSGMYTVEYMPTVAGTNCPTGMFDKINAIDRNASTYIMHGDTNIGASLAVPSFTDILEKSEEGDPLFRFMMVNTGEFGTIVGVDVVLGTKKRNTFCIITKLVNRTSGNANTWKWTRQHTPRFGYW